MPRLAAPSLVIHGSADSVAPPAGGVDVAKNIKGARLEIIEGMGHDMPRAYLPKISDMIIGRMRAHETA